MKANDLGDFFFFLLFFLYISFLFFFLFLFFFFFPFKAGKTRVSQSPLHLLKKENNACNSLIVHSFRRFFNLIITQGNKGGRRRFTKKMLLPTM